MHSFQTITLFVLFSIALVSGATFQLYGLDYTARRINYCPSQAQVNEDMQIISAAAKYVRMYSLVDCNQGAMVLEAIQQLNLPLRVTLGMWLDIYFYAEFPNEYAALQALNNQYGLSKVDSIIVGSETQYRGDFSVDLLISFITNVSTTVKEQMGYPQIQITTADVIDELRSKQQLVAAVDFVAYNQFAFWESQPIANALTNTKNRYQQMVNQAQGKQVVISELGWPSEGEAQGNSVPSFSNENSFFQSVVCWAATNDIPLYYFAAFDSLWQTDDDQKHWGLWNEDRTLKTGISFDFPCSPSTNSATTGTQATRPPTVNSASTNKATTTGKATTIATQRSTSSSSISASKSSRTASTMGKISSTSTAKASTLGSGSSTKSVSSTTGASSATVASSTVGSSSTTGVNTCPACGAAGCCVTSNGAPTCYDPSIYSCLPSGSSNQLCGVTSHNGQKYYEGVCNGGCYDSFCYSCSNNGLQPTGNC